MRTREPSPDQIQMWSSQSAAKHSHRIELLKPLMLELAQKSGEHGVTIGDLRIVAVQRGLIPEESKGRALAYLGALPKACGLIPTERFRRSAVERSHGNLHRVHVLEAYKRKTA